MTDPAVSEKRVRAKKVMKWVVGENNLKRAQKRVEENQGAAGIDGMKVSELSEWLIYHRDELERSLLEGSYQPRPVRGVSIPKAGGGVRQLGIPSVIDRFVQQAILQILDPIVDPSFSEYSYGFRKGRGAHDALVQASEYVQSGKKYVVDMDLSKFFDRVNHDKVMARVARFVEDSSVLKIIRSFLEAGMMENGVCVSRREGTPQGGPLSPLLANMLLDDLDKELERRGHSFCRYADDCNIYVGSLKAAERVMASVKGFVEDHLKLKVNEEKSACASVQERQFLGYRLSEQGTLELSPRSVARLKDRLREITWRKRAVSLEKMLDELESYMTGWWGYFRYAQSRTTRWILSRIDGWIRRRMRCFMLKQCKRPRTMRRFLGSQGISKVLAAQLASSGKGLWRLSISYQSSMAMKNAWFEKQGFRPFVDRYDKTCTS